MADSRETVIQERYRRYVDGFARGEADPDPVMAGLDEESTLQLGRMIDRFLEAGPRPDPKLVGPDHPEVETAVGQILPRLDGRAGGLSRLLVERRSELELSQSDVVGAIAGELEATGEEREKIDAYYHDLEWGSLPAGGLADRLLDSLAAALQSTRESLRAAGRVLGPGRASSSGPVYARSVEPGDAVLGMASPGLPADRSAGTGRRATPPDRIDELFTGG